MDTLLQFIARISNVVYAVAALGVFLAIRGLTQARRRRRIATFGLEREAAEAQIRRSLTAIITLSLLAGTVYIVDNIVVPNLDGETTEVSPTSVVFLTQQPTPTSARLLYPTVTPTVGLPPADVPDETPAAAGEAIDGCEILGATISEPTSNTTVSGQVTVRGEANVLNFAQYKFEVQGPSTAGAWAVVGTYREAVPSGLLGVWDSTSLMPGDYVLRLVVMRQDGSFVTPCEVPITISGDVGGEGSS